MSDASGINGSAMNKKTFKSICLVWLTSLLYGSAQVHAQAPFRLERNEVVAFLGGANMVYLQKAGYLESILSGHFVQSSPQFEIWHGKRIRYSDRERSSNDGANEHISIRTEDWGI